MNVIWDSNMQNWNIANNNNNNIRMDDLFIVYEKYRAYVQSLF